MNRRAEVGDVVRVRRPLKSRLGFPVKAGTLLEVVAWVDLGAELCWPNARVVRVSVPLCDSGDLEVVRVSAEADAVDTSRWTALAPPLGGIVRKRLAHSTATR